MDTEAKSRAIAVRAIQLPEEIAGLDMTDEPDDTRLWHLLRSLLVWCDERRIDFDATLDDVRRGFSTAAA